MQNTSGRRKFVSNLTKAVGTTMLINTPGLIQAEELWANQESMTVGQVMDLILKTIPNAPFPKTVDTLKSVMRPRK